VFAREADTLHYISCASASSDHRRSPADHRVRNDPRRIISSISRAE